MTIVPFGSHPALPLDPALDRVAVVLDPMMRLLPSRPQPGAAWPRTEEVTVATSMDADRRRALRWLEDAGAGEIGHLNGTLLAHLQGIEAMLRTWGAAEPLALAGLCHAAYGTDGFAPRLLEIADRAVLADLIGEEAEAIVYLYAACDRSFLYRQFGETVSPAFRDRFTADEFEPSPADLRAFAELTFANELEIVSTAAADTARIRTALADLLSRMRSVVSEPAYQAAIDIVSVAGQQHGPRPTASSL